MVEHLKKIEKLKKRINTLELKLTSMKGQLDREMMDHDKTVESLREDNRIQEEYIKLLIDKYA